MKKLIQLLLFSLLFMGASAHAVTFPQTVGALFSHSCIKANGSACTTTQDTIDAGYVAGAVCSIYRGPGGTGKTDYYCNGQTTPPYSWQRRYTTSCPTNSTENARTVGQVITCTPNSGYSAVNNSGTWTIVATGSECASGYTYNTTTGVCNQTGPTNLALAAVTAAAGAAVATFLGVTSGTVILATGGLASLLAVGVMSFYSSADPVQTSREAAANQGNAPLTVVLDPNTPLTSPTAKNNDTAAQVQKTSDNKLHPAGGYASPTSSLPSWSGAAGAAQYLKTKNGTVETTVAEISPDQSTLTIYQDNGAQTTVKQYSDGSTNVSYTAGLNTTDSSGASTRIPTTVHNNYNSTGTRSGGGTHYNSTNVNGSSAGGSNGLDEGDPISVGSYGGPGANPTSGSEETPGGCTGADGLNCESTQLSVLAQQTAIKNAITGQGVDHVAAQDGIEGRLESAMDTAAAANTAALDQAGIKESITDTLESLNSIAPWSVLSYNATAECSKTVSMPFGASMKLDICEVQPIIHNVLAFFFFVALCFGIFNLFFERPEGGN